MAAWATMPPCRYFKRSGLPLTQCLRYCCRTHRIIQSIRDIDLAPEIVDGLLTRLLGRDPATQLTVILTGYTRDAATVAVVAAFIDGVRAEHPDIIVPADPVMGEIDLGLLIPEDVAHCVKNQLVARVRPF